MYEYNGDTNGLFYYLGTKALTQNWLNPGTFIILHFFIF